MSSEQHFFEGSFNKLKKDTKIKKLYKSLHHFFQLMITSLYFTLSPLFFIPLCLVLEIEGVNSNILFHTIIFISSVSALISFILLGRSAKNVMKKLYIAQDRFERKHLDGIIKKCVKAFMNQFTKELMPSSICGSPVDFKDILDKMCGKEST